MAKGASDSAGMPNLTKGFNKSSLGSTVGHVLKHVVIMGAMMGVIGLAAAPALAAAGTAGLGGSTALATMAPTVGDMLVQTGHGSWEMLQMLGDTFQSLFSIGGDVVSNVLDGQFAPSTWDSLVMSHGGEHVAHGAMEHGVFGHGAEHSVFSDHVAAGHTVVDHAAAGHAAVANAPSVTFDEWLRNAQASGNLPLMMEDSEALGITLEEHMTNLYGHEGH